VRTDKTYVYTPTTPWEAHSATWRSDGSRIGYVFNFNSLRQIAPNPVPLDFGEELQTDASTMPDFVDLLAWGPPSRANDLLYAGDAFDFTEGASENIYLNTEGSATGGQKLLSFEVWERVLGLAWLPDGSGFLFSRIEVDDLVQAQSANVYRYDFASRQTTRVTNLTDEYAGKLSVSPDGQQVVFERGAALGYLQLEVVDPELWVIKRDGSGLRRLVENGRAPAWGIDAPTSGPTPTEAPPSPTVTSTPSAPQPTIPGLDKRLYLPMAMRGR
jgi:TolB protein